jgi:hypothetical protein
MNIDDIVESTTVPYAAVFKEFTWWDSLFQSNRLAFTMQTQLASNWCWAATSNSVSHFYWSSSTWTQCTIVNAELGRSDACNTPTPGGANVPWYLDRALTRTRNFVSITAGPAPFSTIRAEIDAGRPVGARIGWSGGGGHFVVVYGYSVWRDTLYVDIGDPVNGNSHQTLDDFSTNYLGSGTWTHYYLTRSYRRWWWPDMDLPHHIFTNIWEARQRMLLADATDPERLREAEPDQSRFGLAQPTYSLGLDRLLSGDVGGARRVGVRVFETVRGKPVAFFDVDDAGEGAVRSASRSVPRLEAFAAAIGSAARLVADAEETETRILQVPAVNFEALWVVPRTGGSVLVPTLGAGGLEPGRAYPLEKTLAALREAARPLADMDDTMGA